MGPLILIALCSIALVQPVRLDVNADNHDEILHRTKKARFLGRKLTKGALVVRRLISNAARLPNSEQGFKQYMKHGDFSQAMIDFNTAKIRNIKRYRKPNGEYGMIGVVADRRIHLNNGGVSGRPTIEIRKFQTQKYSVVSQEEGVVTDKITYDPFMG